MTETFQILLSLEFCQLSFTGFLSQVDEIRGEALTAQSRADEASFYEGLKKLYKMEILKKEYEYQAPTVMK